MLRELRRHIGQIIIAGFPGPEVSVELRALAREFDLGGVILFARNVETPDQVAALAFEAAQLGLEVPAWVSVDQEGGRVARLKTPFTEWPPMITLGRSGNEELARRFATALAAELSAVGISLDYAPVLDVHTNPSNPVIGDRALGERADDVARLGRIIVETLQRHGVAACGKHFPGHGDTEGDSHHALPIVEHPPDRIRAVELVPFEAAVQAGVAMIMTAHVLYPALDEERPATLSARIVRGLLREDVGFEGVIASDDLEMRALTAQYSIEEAAVLAVEAGCDVLLLCGEDPDRHARVLEALIHAVESERVLDSRIEDALARQRRAKEQFVVNRETRRPLTLAQLQLLLGRPEHVAVAQEMAAFL
jgi:beta-N-acetylhexosaminidase